MKHLKHLFTALLFILCSNVVGAQEAYTTLPKEFTTSSFDSSWTSELLKFEEPTNGIRVTFFQTSGTNNIYSANNKPMVALSELTITDADGNPVAYNVTTNSLETSEGSLSALFDNDTESFYHSKWREGSLLDDGYVYLELTFERPLSEFTYSHTARNSGNSFFPYYFSFSNVGRTCIPQFFILGENVKGVLDEATGIFTVSGTGDMYSRRPLPLPTDLIKTVVIEEGVTSIGSSLFSGCTGLTSITIPNSVTSIGEEAFYRTAWYNNQPDGVVYAGKVLYSYKGTMPSNTSITIKDGTLGIAGGAFYGCTGLTSIEIPNSVTSIGSSAFYGCTGLTSVVIPNSVTSIGSSAFYGCTGLTSVVIPNSVTSIGSSAFRECTGLTSITIPNSVTSIGNYAFSGCTGLTSITIPNSVTSIGNYAFYGTAWYDDQPDGVVYAGKVLYEYKGTMPSNTSIIIKDGTLGIAYHAFRGCTGLTSVTIPNSVTSIGSSAFSGCTGLTSITIPNSVTSIGDDAFYRCTGLTSITIPNSVKSIGGGVFSGCSGLTSITIPNSVKSIGNYAFNGCTGLTSIEIGNSVTSIGNKAFYGCTGLTSITIPNSVKSIGGWVFSGCSGLTSIEIPNSVTSIGSSVFENCTGLKEVHISDLAAWCNISFDSSNANPLYYAKKLYLNDELITELTIPNSVRNIRNYAFYNCSGLTSITIPNSVKSIGGWVFNGCTSLKELRIEDGEGTLSLGYNTYDIYDTGKGLFYDCPLETLYLGRNLSYNTGRYYGYSPFYNIKTLASVTIGNSVTSIGERSFYGCTELTNITIPNNVTSIGSSAFYGCTELTNITIPNNVTSIGDYAFYRCTGLTSIEIPNSVTSIGSSAFLGCTGLTNITIPNSVTSIGERLFFDCSGLKSVVIPSSVTSIGKDAFTGCTGLKTVYNFSNLTFYKGSSYNGYVAYYADKIYNLPNGSKEGDFVFGKPNDVNTLLYYLGNTANLILPTDYKGENYVIGTDVFKGNTTITSVVIPGSVTSIGGSAFYGCDGLTSVVIGNSVTSIGNQAFYNCTGLKTVYNYSKLTFSKGSSSNGNVAYYADKVYNAPNGFIDGDFIWYENEDGMTLAGYLGNATVLAMPTDYNGKSVTSIGNQAFDGCTGLTSIEIPNSVTSIGNQAFYGCTGLRSIEIPNSVTSIGYEAFSGCTGLTSIEIPNSVTSIGSSAFSGCTGLKEVHISDLAAWCNISFDSSNANPLYYAKKLYLNDELITELTIPNSVRNIRNYAFYNCTGLTSITIPNSVTSIGNYAFYNCTGLTSITIPNSVTSIGSFALYNCTGLETVYNFSNLTFSKGSSYNGYVAYYATKVINAPNAIIDGDFIWCNLNGANTLACYLGEVPELTLPADYNGENYVIGNDAFNGCTGLTSITIPNSVTSIGNQAFENCTELKTVYNFSNLTFSKGSSYNGYVAYYATKVINAPNAVIDGDFIWCNLNGANTLACYLGEVPELTLPADYNGENYVIGNDAFNGCTGLTSITIPNSVTSIGNQAFYNCSELNEVHISDLSAWCNISFGSSNANPLYYAKNLYLNNELITELAIPNSVRNIRNYAFYNCSGLTSITIPNSVTSIGNQAFENCTGLKTVINFSNLTFSKGSSYNGYVAYYATKVINAPNAVIDGDFIWCNLNGANTLACYLGEVAELTLPADYIGENYVIGNDAFNGCTGLASVVIPSKVTNIGEDAFIGCTGLKTVYNFSNLTFGKGENTNGYVAYYADKVYNAPNGSIEGDFIFGKPNDVNTLLYYLGNTANLILPTDYNGENYVIDSAVFKDNIVFTSITIPNSVTSVGDDAFTGCTNVEKLYLDCAEVGDWFSGVSAMKEITIGNGVTSVVASAFNGCTGLEKVCINDLVAWCGIDFGNADANPLYYAKNLYLNGELLTELSIPSEIEEVKDYAFYNCKGVTNVDVVDGVKSIGNSAFYGCNDLETLYISNTIESIGDYAFAECNNILDIKIGSKKAITASENIFSSDAYNNACLYVPTGRKDFYAKTSPWSNFIIKEMDFTGIESVEAERVKDVYYDLSGRAVENPANGIYIVNGKKVIIK